jgi:hypothetical protein
MNRYKKAFKKHLPAEFEQWKNRVKSGKGKVNAKQLMPHELVTPAQLNNDLTQLQWEALREHARTKGSLKGIMPVCDFSGSMHGIPHDVSMALGIMISELAEGPFANLMISFSESPTFFKFEGSSLKAKVEHARSSGVSQGFNTDIIRCFQVLLQKCLDAKVAPEDMPKKILILTDGQFDQQTTNCNLTAFQAIKVLYETKGYTPPVLVLWNLRGNVENVPVTKHESGAQLISGWSVNLLKSVLDGSSHKETTPEETMQKALSDERYSRIQL